MRSHSLRFIGWTSFDSPCNKDKKSSVVRDQSSASIERTIAVLGSGIRHIHPRENVELAEQIVRCGAILSELHPNTPPKGQNLMARDRIISGLSRAVIVIEAGEKSGSLDTAAKAIKQGRLVYAVPGSAGTEQLIASGVRRIDPAAINFDQLVTELTESPKPDERTAPQQSSFW